ncbi:Bacterial extracellular solute-binding protein, family 3 [compost metagenome]
MRVLAIIILLFGLSETHAVGKEISIALYDLPPHMHMGPKGPQGAIPEFMNKYVFVGSSWKPRWRVNQFARIMKDLENGRVDMAVMVAKTTEREHLFEYSALPLYQTHSGVIVKKDFKVNRLDSLEPLRGMKLGHDLASIVPSYFKGAGVNFYFISGENYFRRNLQLLKSGRVDGIFVPTWSHATFELQNNTDFTILELPEGALDLYIVFKKNINPEFSQYVNKVLKTQKSEYLKILKRCYNVSTDVRKSITFNN